VALGKLHFLSLFKERSQRHRSGSQLCSIPVQFSRKEGEDVPFVKPRDKDREAPWETQIEQAAVNVERVQVVLQGFAHDV
jgi:hypothetical protein